MCVSASRMATVSAGLLTTYTARSSASAASAPATTEPLLPGPHRNHGGNVSAVEEGDVVVTQLCQPNRVAVFIDGDVLRAAEGVDRVGDLTGGDDPD